MTSFAFDAFVAAAVFDRAGRAWFALGDGRVCDEAGGSWAVHDGAVLCAAAHPAGDGLLTGGEDGRVAWTRTGGAETLYQRPGRWIDALAASPASGLYACAAGREVEVRDARDPAFARRFTHERSVAALAFEPKGRRLAAATYGGVALWYARIAEQRPQMLKWAGSHIELAWSPDARFIVTSMQENALHGWRLSDGKDMRMGGYPAKVRSLAFLARGRMLATSGAAGAVVWPFAGADGPMGRSAAELAPSDDGLAVRVAAAPDADALALARSDGSVSLVQLADGATRILRPLAGSPVSALAVSPDGRRVAFGDEAGAAGLVSI